MAFLILSIALQAALIIHCIKTGRNTIWIWVIALLSYAGIIAYLAVEVIPELLRGRTAQRAGRSLRKAVDPGRDLRRMQHEAQFAGNVASRQRLAEELARGGQYDEAIAEYRKTLTGLYEHDPNLMLGLAHAQFGKGEPAVARATLDELIQHNADFKSPQGHLLYARALEGEGNYEKALEEYSVVAHSFPGAEAAARYALLLKERGDEAQASKVAQELLEEARVAPPHYRKAQREWLSVAERLVER